MLLRLSRCVTRGSLQRVVAMQPVRNLRVSAIAMSGGHHFGPLESNIPIPGSKERTIFGEQKFSRNYESNPYIPGKDDYLSYVYAAIGVVLTGLAVTYFTDVFGKNVGVKHLHHKEFKDQKSAHGAPAEEDECCKKIREEKDKSQAQEAAAAKVETKPVAPVADVAPVKSESVQTTAKPSHGEHEESKPVASTSSGDKEEPTSSKSDLKEVSTKEPKERKEEPKAPKEETKAPKEEPKETQTTEVVAESSSSAVVEESVTDEPSTSGKKFPEYVEYLLVGAGSAAYYAAIAIRAKHADAKVVMVGEESHLPYNRPPLSKELWWYGDEKGSNNFEYVALSGKKRDIYLEAKGFFVEPNELNQMKHGGVCLLSNKKVIKICPDDKKAFLDDGSEISFSKCLIATGGRPRQLAAVENVKEDVAKRILYFRDADDYRKLDKLCASGKSMTIVGGGFLGTELAYGIKRRYENVKVNQVIAESGNLSAVLPKHISNKSTENLRAMGVNVVTNAKVTGAKKNGESIEVQLSNGNPVTSDYVVVAVGVEPETTVAEASGFEIDAKYGGVLADAELQIQSGIYCAGDVCSFFDKSLGRRRIEHWEHAQVSGRLAGENMTGGNKAFWYQPSYFTKISPRMVINGVGNTDAKLRTVTVFSEPTADDANLDRAVVFYKGEGDKVVGVLLLNVFGPSIDVARRIIEDARPVKDFRELAKLFPLYEPPKAEDVKEKEIKQE